ncbi:hypothetical protein [Gordonia soli]|uniref:Uncharacterized protein n=1 Tax=Gordonia soli NBRC 108243 TaxID=1223545 RepID=M0QL43_9ACTN|nr:hypothetical protein [Gordonia soli]GAC69350.1 hypothetical protein GS4_23_01470 [Gordonia soli NBRC 108243]
MSGDAAPTAAQVPGDRGADRAAAAAAWESSTGPADRSRIALALADLSTDDDERLDWARQAVAAASDADYATVRDQLVTLYTTLADAYRRAGDDATAQRHFLTAADTADALESAGTPVRGADWAAITTGLVASGFVPRGVSEDLGTLIEALVSTDRVGALSLLLPAVHRCAGTDEQVANLVNTLETLLWTPGLVDPEHRALVVAASAVARLEAEDTESAPVVPAAAYVSPTTEESVDGIASATDASTSAEPAAATAATDDVHFRI